LLGRKVVTTEKRVFDRLQAIIGAPEVQKSLLFERVEPVGLGAGALAGGP
jgi:hypothetical protein